MMDAVISQWWSTSPADTTSISASCCPETAAEITELQDAALKVNLVSPAFIATATNNFAGTESVEDGSREVVRVTLRGPDGPTGNFSH